MSASLVGSEMCIRDRVQSVSSTHQQLMVLEPRDWKSTFGADAPNRVKAFVDELEPALDQLDKAYDRLLRMRKAMQDPAK
eukprot:14139060-Alexandrium_andersonii.AAC.1